MGNSPPSTPRQISGSSSQGPLNGNIVGQQGPDIQDLTQSGRVPGTLTQRALAQAAAARELEAQHQYSVRQLESHQMSLINNINNQNLSLNQMNQNQMNQNSGTNNYVQNLSQLQQNQGAINIPNTVTITNVNSVDEYFMMSQSNYQNLSSTSITNGGGSLPVLQGATNTLGSVRTDFDDLALQATSRQLYYRQQQIAQAAQQQLAQQQAQQQQQAQTLMVMQQQQNLIQQQQQQLQQVQQGQNLPGFATPPSTYEALNQLNSNSKITTITTSANQNLNHNITNNVNTNLNNNIITNLNDLNDLNGSSSGSNSSDTVFNAMNQKQQGIQMNFTNSMNYNNVTPNNHINDDVAIFNGFQNQDMGLQQSNSLPMRSKTGLGTGGETTKSSIIFGDSQQYNSTETNLPGRAGKFFTTTNQQQGFNQPQGNNGNPNFTNDINQIQNNNMMNNTGNTGINNQGINMMTIKAVSNDQDFFNYDADRDHGLQDHVMVGNGNGTIGGAIIGTTNSNGNRVINSTQITTNPNSNYLTGPGPTVPTSNFQPVQSKPTTSMMPVGLPEDDENSEIYKKKFYEEREKAKANLVSFRIWGRKQSWIMNLPKLTLLKSQQQQLDHNSLAALAEKSQITADENLDLIRNYDRILKGLTVQIHDATLALIGEKSRRISQKQKLLEEFRQKKQQMDLEFEQQLGSMQDPNGIMGLQNMVDYTEINDNVERPNIQKNLQNQNQVQKQNNNSASESVTLADTITDDLIEDREISQLKNQLQQHEQEFLNLQETAETEVIALLNEYERLQKERGIIDSDNEIQKDQDDCVQITTNGIDNDVITINGQNNQNLKSSSSSKQQNLAIPLEVPPYQSTGSSPDHYNNNNNGPGSPPSQTNTNTISISPQASRKHTIGMSTIGQCASADINNNSHNELHVQAAAWEEFIRSPVPGEVVEGRQRAETVK